MTSLASSIPSPALVDDALREIVNVGTGHALSALSRLVHDATVLMTPVRCVATAESMLRGAPEGVVVTLDVAVPAMRFVLVFDDVSSRRWAARMLGRPRAAKVRTELEDSALLELGNILACAFLDTIAKMTRLRLVPGLPRLEAGRLPVLLAAIDEPQATVLATRFLLRSTRLSGRLVLACSPAGREALARALF